MADNHQVITVKVVPFKFRKIFEKDEKPSSYQEFVNKINKVAPDYPEETFGSVWMQGLREIRPILYDLIHSSPSLSAHDQSQISDLVANFASSFWDE